MTTTGSEASMEQARFTLTRSVLIHAPRDVVFSFFQDDARFARWWGAGSCIEPKAGGRVLIVYPNGVTVSGSVVDIEPPFKVVFTYGYDDPKKPFGPGSTTVSLTFEERDAGTLVKLVHSGLPTDETRLEHDPGWRFQLSVFAKAAAEVAHADVEDVVDRWVEAWNLSDAADVEKALVAATTDDVTFRDGYACIAGRADLVGHIAAIRRFVATSLRREGPVHHVQGAALFAFVTEKDGAVVSRGTNAMELAPDGRVKSAVGFPSS